MSLPLLSRNKIVAVGIESTPGTAVSTSVLYGILDASYDVEISYNEQPYFGSLSYQTGTTGSEKATITIKGLWTGSGTTATAPLWATKILPASGFLATSNVYTSNSLPSNWSTLTVDVFISGVRYRASGCMGEFKVLEAESGKTATWEWKGQGQHISVSDQSQPSSVANPTVPPVSNGNTFTLGSGFTPLVSKITIDMGAEVAIIPAMTASGFIQGMITGKKPKLSIDPLMTSVANKDWNGIWKANTEQGLQFVLGSTAGNQFVFASPKVQFMAVKAANRNNVQTNNIEAMLNADSSVGVDTELSITFN